MSLSKLSRNVVVDHKSRDHGRVKFPLSPDFKLNVLPTSRTTTTDRKQALLPRRALTSRLGKKNATDKIRSLFRPLPLTTLMSGTPITDESEPLTLSFDDVDSLQMAGSMLISQTDTYRFLLKGFSTVSSSAGGIVAAFIPCDPSSTGFNFGEYSSLAALFSEVRLVGFRVQVVSVTSANGISSNENPLIIGSNNSTSSAPTSVGQVVALPDSKFWSALHDTSALGYTHIVKVPSYGWSLTSSVTATPYAGCPGCVQIYGTANAGLGAQTVFLALVMGEYEFRSRY
jgi:hypothetical protein